MAKPYTKSEPQKSQEDVKELPRVKYLRMEKQPGSADKWDLFEGVATCLPETEKRIEVGQPLIAVRYAYDVAKAKRLHKRQGDAK